MEENYLIDPGLQHAVECAYQLGRPLLLTGEPGTGKTTLATWALDHLSKKFGKQGEFYEELLQFNTKTTSTARELFYFYDALSHYRAAHIQSEQKDVQIQEFIDLQALGKAIAISNPQKDYPNYFKTKISGEGGGLNSVVLIDEIDKAPRDFTNDILDEIDHYRFEIKEKDNFLVKKGDGKKIFVVLTSNSEKNLPDAFLRRCAFYHIDFPDKDKLRQIVTKKFRHIDKDHTKQLDELILYFERFRKESKRKKPATAELLNWIKVLELDKYFTSDDAEERKKALRQNLPFLIKTREDMDMIRQKLEDILKP